MHLRTMPPAGKVALAYSGGLDSTLCIRLLQEYYEAKEVILVLVDIGQGEADLAAAARTVESLDARLVTVDARNEFTNEWVARAIAANGRYGDYPLSSSMTRQLIASKVAAIAVQEGCDAVAEGSTGKGNDQFRFHNTFTYLAPGLRVLAPIRDFNLSRADERRLAQSYRLPFHQGISDDKTSWGRALGSGEIDDLGLQVPSNEFLWWVPPEQASDHPSTHQVEFLEGIPVRMDWAQGLESIIASLNETGGGNGIGRVDVIEDGIMGLKSREVYEAPAATILLDLHGDLERLCLTKEELRFKQMVDSRWSDLVYHGGWFHPLRLDLDAFVAQSQKVVSGTIVFQVYKGNVAILERRSPLGLFDPAVRSLEHDSFDQSEMKGAVEAHAFEYAMLRDRNRRRASQRPRTSRSS